MANNGKISKEKQDKLGLEAQIEALLFVAPGSVSVKQLGDSLNKKKREIEKGISALEEQYKSRGIRLLRHKGELKLTSAPELALKIENFLKLEANSRFSSAALECLSIIAYQQPVTRPQIDSIRGVNSDGVLRNMLSNGLVEEAGRTEGPGRPILYVTTPDFLQHFGLKELEELPPLQIDRILDQQSNDNPDSLLKE